MQNPVRLLLPLPQGVEAVVIEVERAQYVRELLRHVSGCLKTVFCKQNDRNAFKNAPLYKTCTGADVRPRRADSAAHHRTAA